MPSPLFRPRTVAGDVWPSLALPEGAQVWAAYLTLDASQWLPPERIAEGQLTQLRALLAHAAQHVPYYRDQFRANRIRPDDIRTMEDLASLPILERRSYQAEHRRLQAEQLPPGTRAVGSLSTSGTSGVPIEVLQTDRLQLWFLAFLLRDLDWTGLDPRATLASIRPARLPGALGRKVRDGFEQPSWGEEVQWLIETGRSWIMDIHEDPRKQLDWLRRIAPDYLLTHASNAEFLAALAVEAGVRLPGLRRIQTISEMLGAESRARIAAAFGVPVGNMYSCSEAGYVASECPQGHGWHVHAENVILEVLDDAGRPCGPGSTGRVVLTTLHNFLAPFVRYEIMDDAEVGPARCACGRGLPTLTRIVGKRHVILRLPGGRAKTSSDLLHHLRELGGFHQFQVVQRAVDRFAIHVVPNASWTEAHPARVSALVREHCEAPVTVEVLSVERIELTAGGKVREVVTELGLDQAEPRKPARARGAKRGR